MYFLRIHEGGVEAAQGQISWRLQYLVISVWATTAFYIAESTVTFFYIYFFWNVLCTADL